MLRIGSWAALVAASALSPAVAVAGQPAESAAVNAVPAPQVDHHFHLTSPAIAAVINGRPLATVEVPPAVGALLAARAQGWNDSEALAALFVPDATVLVQSPQKAALFRGRSLVAKYLAGRFGKPYRMVAVAQSLSAGTGSVTGYYVRGEGEALQHVGVFQLALAKQKDGAWRIASEIPAFPSAPPQRTVLAEDAIAMLDAAGIRRAVVLSNAGAFGGRTFDPAGQEEPAEQLYARVKAENDWSVAQVSKFPERLISFCSLNPLAAHALDELRRCAATGHRGLKMQFFESMVELQNPAHVERVRAVFALANALRLSILVHVENNRGADAVVAANVATLLDRIAVAAPDVTIQLAHLWGGGAYSEAALNAYADAVSSGHPATRNIVFDVAEAALVASGAGPMKQPILDNVAKRIRQIGVERILFGSDQFGGNHRKPTEAWQMFVGEVPLTEAEFAAIAANVAPYLR
jgi:predicted TIM-barrel fold metal-dependent hydrolase